MRLMACPEFCRAVAMPPLHFPLRSSAKARERGAPRSARRLVAAGGASAPEIPAAFPGWISRRDLSGLGARLQMGRPPKVGSGPQRAGFRGPPPARRIRADRGNRDPDRIPHQSAFFVRENGVARCRPLAGRRQDLCSGVVRSAPWARPDGRALPELDPGHRPAATAQNARLTWPLATVLDLLPSPARISSSSRR